MGEPPPQILKKMFNNQPYSGKIVVNNEPYLAAPAPHHAFMNCKYGKQIDFQRMYKGEWKKPMVRTRLRYGSD